MYKGASTRLIADFSTENMKVMIKWVDIFKVLENHDQKGNSRTAHQSGQKQLLEGVVQNQKTKPRETEEQEQTGE